MEEEPESIPGSDHMTPSIHDIEIPVAGYSIGPSTVYGIISPAIDLTEQRHSSARYIFVPPPEDQQ